MKKMQSPIGAVAACFILSTGIAMGKPIEIDSLRELAEYAQQDEVSVQLKPGTYVLNDPAIGQELDMKLYQGDTSTSDYPAEALILFSGNHSTYDLTGAEIRLDTKLHQAFGKRKLFEIFVAGTEIGAVICCDSCI